MKHILSAVFVFCLLSLPMQAQSLYDELNEALLIAEKTDRAIERGKINNEQVLYEAFEEDDPDYDFTGHTTVTLWQAHDGFIRMTTLHEWNDHEPEVKSLYLDASFHPIVLIDESNHDFKKCVVFESEEPSIYAEADWVGEHYTDYMIYRITPKEYRYATQILSQYEHVLEDWVKSVQRKANKRRVGEYAAMNQMAVQAQPTQTQATPEQQLKQAAGALLIQSLDQALQKWLK
ncbi:MAG: hypothetical protein SNJ55_01250 [Chloroherpetonaceae bacterium]